MVKMVLKYFLVLFAILGANSGFSQKHLLSEVHTNTTRVYVGEPVEVSLKIYTRTWFTSGVQVQNLQVPNAFTILSNSFSISKTINGQTYAGVEFVYQVFPYSEKDMVFPSLTIQVETPDEGDYKGVKRTLKTKSVSVRVRPIPFGFEIDQWMVTPHLLVRESWSGNLSKVKVGDVLERKIYRKATQTLYELMPPIKWDTVAHVSNYPNRTKTHTQKNKTNFYAERTDVMRYLFEKEGEIILPEITITWWNSEYKKQYKKTLKEVRIMVQPNPNLGMITSIKDSLALVKANSQEVGIQEDETFSFMGLTWKELIAVGLAGYFVLKYWIKVVLFLIRKITLKWHLFYQSESYYFGLFLLSLFTNESKKERSFYRWIDCLKLDEYTLSYYKNHFCDDSEAKIPSSISYWKRSRKIYLAHTSKDYPIQNNWINP